MAGYLPILDPRLGSVSMQSDARSRLARTMSLIKKTPDVFKGSLDKLVPVFFTEPPKSFIGFTVGNVFCFSMYSTVAGNEIRYFGWLFTRFDFRIESSSCALVQPSIDTFGKESQEFCGEPNYAD